MSSIEGAKRDIREYLAQNRDDLHADGERLAAFMRADHARFRRDIAGLIVAARTDPVAFDALAEMQDHYIQTGEPTPANLALAMRDIARGEMKRPSKRGRRPSQKRSRNSVIIAAASIAKHAHGFQLYDGELAEHTASSMIAELLPEQGVHIDAGAVKQILVRRNRSRNI